MIRDFKVAWQAGDIRGLLDLLDPDATVVADGGGIVPAALEPIAGAEPIATFLIDLDRRFAASTVLLERTVNGQPGLVAQEDGVIVTVFAFDVVGDRISHIWAIRNPRKLQPWR